MDMVVVVVVAIGDGEGKWPQGEHLWWLDSNELLYVDGWLAPRPYPVGLTRD